MDKWRTQEKVFSKGIAQDRVGAGDGTSGQASPRRQCLLQSSGVPGGLTGRVWAGDSLGQGTAGLVGWFSGYSHHQVILPPSCPSPPPGTTVPGHQVQAR